MDFAVKIKEKEKIDKYLELARELKLMKVVVIPIVVGALGTVSKGQRKRLDIRGRIKTIETTALLTSARILRRILKM